MQAAAETNGVRAVIAACQTGNETGSGNMAAADADSVQIGQWVIGLTGAPASSGAGMPSCDVQITKNESESAAALCAAAWLAML